LPSSLPAFAPRAAFMTKNMEDTAEVVLVVLVTLQVRTAQPRSLPCRCSLPLPASGAGPAPCC
jgi:hypothetical protein